MSDRKPAPAEGRQLPAILLAIALVIVVGAAAAISTHRVYRYFADPCARAGREWIRVKESSQYDTAVHEAGHVIASYLLAPDQPIDRAYVAVERCSDDRYLGQMAYDDGVEFDDDPEMIRRQAVIDFAGEAAEKALVGSTPPDSYEDKDNAERRLWERCTEHRACDREVVLPDGSVRMLKEAVSEKEAAAFNDATILIRSNEQAVIELANLLMMRPAENRSRTIRRKELYLFLESKALANPLDPADP